MTKNISVIGKGTAGCLTALKFHNLGYKIDWYYDSNTPALSVGEGTDLILPEFLYEELGITYDDFNKFDVNYKQGIEKINWSRKPFTHWFALGKMALHINATKLQSYIFNHLKDKVNIIEKNIEHKDINNYIIDCTGKPKGEMYDTPIPVNKAYIVQCPWEKPTFKKTICLAEKHGWLFLIPLQNRCSVGYLYNEDCSSKEEIKEGIEKITKGYNLNIQEEKEISFSNYYRKENFTKNISYNGNASFFLEPIEATSLNTIVRVIDQIHNVVVGNDENISIQNTRYKNFLDETVDIIMLHYLNRPNFVSTDNLFWNLANEKAEEWFSMRYKTYPKINLITEPGILRYSTWYEGSFKQNLYGLNLYEKLNKFKVS